tara:strand:+ start:1331 stop:1597 length:267 start_codon:yes stop_codon:yes gene_type:complete
MEGKGKKMNCWHCNTELIWGSDFTYEDYCIEGEGIVSTFSCPNCNAHVEVYLGDDAIGSKTPEEAMKKYTAKLKKENNKFKKEKNGRN